MALMHPDVTSMKFGFACPGLAFVPMDFDTTAPAPDFRTLTMDSPVSSNIPDARIPGLSSSRLPILVYRELILSPL